MIDGVYSVWDGASWESMWKLASYMSPIYLMIEINLLFGQPRGTEPRRLSSLPVTVQNAVSFLPSFVPGMIFITGYRTSRCYLWKTWET